MKRTNCVNCGAVIDYKSNYCAYCGTDYVAMGVLPQTEMSDTRNILGVSCKDFITSLDENEKTVQDVFNEFTEEQKTVVYALIDAALADAGGSDEDEDNDDVKHLTGSQKML